MIHLLPEIVISYTEHKSYQATVILVLSQEILLESEESVDVWSAYKSLFDTVTKMMASKLPTLKWHRGGRTSNDQGSGTLSDERDHSSGTLGRRGSSSS